MKHFLATLALLILLYQPGSSAMATPKIEPQTLTADLSYWGLNPNAPYPKLIFYEGGVPWMGWVGSPIYYEYVPGGCTQVVNVFVPGSTCPVGCKKAIVEGVANAYGVYRVLRFDAGDEWWGSDPIPYQYDSSTNILTLTLPNTCNGGH